MLAIDKLTKSYANVKAVDDLSMEISSGEVVGLLGSNGSGKTTVINSICSLVEYDSGEVYFNGSSIKESTNYLREIGAVLEGTRNVHWRFTVMQNARYFSTIRGGVWKDLKSDVGKLINELGLAPHINKETGMMSTGNRQKVALVCALVHRPKLLLLDEPTLGLDLDTVNTLKEFLLFHAKEQNRSILITSHDLQFLNDVCSRVVVLNKGKKIYDGALDSFKQRLHKYELSLDVESGFDGSLRTALDNAIEEKSVLVKYSDEKLTVKYNEPKTGMLLMSEASQRLVNPKSIEIKEMSMEQAYISCIEEGV